MIISHKYKFIFIKTRKTAGSSIEKYLFEYLGPNDICSGSSRDNTPRLNVDIGKRHYKDGHLPWTYIKENWPEEWNSYFKFAVDRNPWDKTVSYYYWIKHSKPKKTKNGFEAFVMDEKFSSYNCWSKYADQNNIVVDALLPYESLHNEFLNLPIPYNNELLSTFVKGGLRKKQSYKEFYTDNTYNKVNQVFSNTINYFGYTF
jgi:hypothetical protein